MLLNPSGQRANHRFARSQRTPCLLPNAIGLCPVGSFPKANPGNMLPKYPSAHPTDSSITQLTFLSNIHQRLNSHKIKHSGARNSLNFLWFEFRTNVLKSGALSSPPHSQRPRILGRIYYKEETAANIPSDVFVLDYPHIKTGRAE